MKKKSSFRDILLFVAIIAILTSVASFLFEERAPEKIQYSDIVRQFEASNVEKGLIDGEGMLKLTVANAVEEAYAPGETGEADPSVLKKSFSFLWAEGEAVPEEKQAAEELLLTRAMALQQAKEERYGAEKLREHERTVLLCTVDEKWMDHIDAMSDLSDTIHLRAYGQKDPLVEYKMLGSEMFSQMVDSIRNDTVMTLLRTVPAGEEKRKAVVKTTGASHGAQAPAKKEPVKKSASEKVGRNELCPCGSGLKYKKCCGSGKSQED